MVSRLSFAQSSRNPVLCQDGFDAFFRSLRVKQCDSCLIEHGYNLSNLETLLAFESLSSFRKILKSVENYMIDYQSVTKRHFANE